MKQNGPEGGVSSGQQFVQGQEPVRRSVL